MVYKCTMDILTHYTRDLQAIVGILNNGFAWVPNRRELMPQLVPDYDFSKREPQEFGMISFTDLTPPATQLHRKEFGYFGVVVSREWAQSEGAQRVIYLPSEGPVAKALQWLYTAAYEHLRKEHSGNVFAQMAVSASTNKALAGVDGGPAVGKFVDFIRIP